MMHCPIPHRQSDSATTVSNRGVSRMCRWALYYGLLLILQLLMAVPGQSRRQQESGCTFTPRPVLVGLTATPDDDWFGIRTSLSQDGTIAAIGAPQYDNDGSGSFDGYVQVFRFANNAWTQLGRIIFGDNLSSTCSNALSDDGSVLAVGGWNTSSVQVFRLVVDDWESLGNSLTNPSGEDIGHALAISGDGTILAASNTFGQGEVLVFELVGDTWSQKGRTLQGPGENEDFGYSVTLSQGGSRLAVGIPAYSNAESNGFVMVFEFIDNDWVQIGQTLQGTNVGVWFGYDVSLSSDGQTLAVGSPGYSDYLGSVNVYRFGSDGQWFDLGLMLIGKSGNNERFGESVALSGDAPILVASSSSLLRYFKANGNEWIEVEEEATISTSYNNAAISRDGSTAMGGASVFEESCPQQTTTAPTTPFSPSPSPTTRAPVSLPTTAPVEAPVETPRTVPVLSPSPNGSTKPPVDNPSPTTSPPAAKTAPASAPQTNPVAGTTVEENFSDVSLSFINVSIMSQPETETFEQLTKEWYETFFNERSGRVLQSLQLDAQNMQTTIEVMEQNVYLSEDDTLLVNKITYKQTIAYVAESNVDAKSYITLPFEDLNTNIEYGETLKSQLVVFQGLQSPLPIPQFENNEGEGSAIGVIVGASIGVAVLLAIAVLVGIRLSKRNEETGESVIAVQQSNTPAESQYQTSVHQPSSVVDFQDHSLAYASGVIVCEEQGEALAPQTLVAQAVVVASDNPALTTPSDGYILQFKDQTRSAASERLAQRDP